MNAEPPILSFVDTNIWLYAFIDNGEKNKSKLARHLLVSTQPIVSVQVINEVCVNLIKKAGFNEKQIRQLIDSYYEKCLVVELNQLTLTTASDLRQSYLFSFWDSLIIPSALQSKAAVLYSEDLQNKQVVEDRLKIVNPFNSG